MSFIVCGIDYSLSSPAITIHSGDKWDVKNCKFFYFAKKKHLLNDGVFYGSLYPDNYINDSHRYDLLSKWALDIIKDNGANRVFIEGYAFGAVGRTFHIAENTGLLKYKIWKEEIKSEVYPPSMIKKYATGKGNAKKDLLYEEFKKETSIDIRDRLYIINNNIWNPISDIVDSYYIAKLGFLKERENAD